MANVRLPFTEQVRTSPLRMNFDVQEDNIYNEYRNSNMTYDIIFRPRKICYVPISAPTSINQNRLLDFGLINILIYIRDVIELLKIVIE